MRSQLALGGGWRRGLGAAIDYRGFLFEHVERVDCLIRHIARQQGLQCDTLDEIVALVDERLAKNRAAGGGNS